MKTLPCVAALSLLILAGCAGVSPSIPDGYTGPRAQLDDSYTMYSSRKGDFFFAEQVNGVTINNTLRETTARNQGRGMVMAPFNTGRPIMAETAVKVQIKGRTHYAAPILELTNTVYQVAGTVEFTPKANVKYIVRGEMSQDHSAVWIEELESREIVGKKVEVNGSAALGVLEK